MLSRTAIKFRPGVSFLTPTFVASSMAVVVLAAILAHLHIANVGEDYTGPLSILDRVFDLSLALGLIAFAFCIGRRISRKLSLEFKSLAEEMAFSVALGTGTMGLILLGMGLAGMLKPLPIIIFIVTVLVLTHNEAAGLYRLTLEGLRRATATRKRLILSSLFGMMVLLLALRTSTPPHAFDEAIYHLSVTKLFVERGRVFPFYDNWAGNLPFLLQMPYVICLMAKADIAAKLFSLILALISALALYGFCARFLTRHIGTVAMFAFFGAGMVVEVAVTARIDVSFAGILFLAAYAMMVYFETGQRRWLYVSAICSGFGLGIKHTAGLWLLSLGVMFLFESFYRNRDSIANVLKNGLIFTAIAAAVAMPWYVKNLVWFHDPLHPFIRGEVAEAGPDRLRFFDASDEQKLNRHFEVARAEIPEFVDSLDKGMAELAAQRVERNSFHFWEYFTKPDVYSSPAEPYHDPNYLFVITPLFLFFSRRRWLVWLATLSLTSYFLFASLSPTSRYLLPIFPPLTVLAAFTLCSLAARLRSSPQLAKALPAVIVGFTVCSALVICLLHFYRMGTLSFVRGDMSRREFMHSMFYHPVLDYINHELPKDARVMMIGAQMCYDLQRDYIADLSWETTEWRRLLIRNQSLEEVSQELKQRGVTHILFTSSLFRYAAFVGAEGLPQPLWADQKAGGPDYQVQLRNWATFELFRRKFLEPVHNDIHDYQLYSIK